MLAFEDWHNSQNPNDVDLNGLVEPHDAFVQISLIRTLPGQSVTIAAFSLPPNAKVNTNNDPYFDANDIYSVINEVGDPNNEIADELTATLLTVSLGTPASILENETEVLALPVTNAENEPLTHTITGGVDAAHFEINAATNTLCFIEPPDFENPTDADGNNVYQVEVTADNGAGDLDPTLFDVTVLDDATDNAPEFTTPADLSIPENSTFVRDFEAVDPQGDTVTFSISGGEHGEQFTIPANTSQLRFALAPNFEMPIGTLGANEYEVEIRADDGNGNSRVKTFHVHVTDVNERPTITGGSIRIGPDRTTAPKENLIRNVIATDPDFGDFLSYSIEEGNTEGLFAIHPTTGKITLVSELWTATATVFVLRLRATDASGLFDEANLTITLKNTSVGIAGDTQAIEVAGDKIQLRFVRLSSDISAPLPVQFTVQWSQYFLENLSADDFLPGQGKTDLLAGSIVIPENQDEVTLELVPALDNDSSEVRERALIALLEGTDYAVVTTQVELHDPEKKNIWMSYKAEIEVLEKATLFANGKPNAPDAARVDMNVVRQGYLPDCYFLAVLLHLAQYNGAFIESAVRENLDTAAPHDYKVRFFNAQNEPDWVDVTLDFSRGIGGVHLSGDHDENGFEIWPMVFEQAYAELRGGYHIVAQGGFADEVWRLLTGRNATRHNVTTWTDEQILQKIRDEEGQRFFLGTQVNSPDIGGKHAYSVHAVGSDTLTLYDPIRVTIPSQLSFSRLNENVDTLTIADAP